MLTIYLRFRGDVTNSFLIDLIADTLVKISLYVHSSHFHWERSGSVVECLTRDQEPHRCHCAVSLSKTHYPSLVLVQPRKTCPYITERLLMGHKESNHFNQYSVANTCTWSQFLKKSNKKKTILRFYICYIFSIFKCNSAYLK